MIILITPDTIGRFHEEVTEMYRLRYRVFKGRLDWTVQVVGDMEFDKFDAQSPSYLVQKDDETGRIVGCNRLLPTMGPNMLRDTFSVLLEGSPAPADELIWESSRFSIDTFPGAPTGKRGISRATYVQFAGVLEFGLSKGLSQIVTVTDTRFERILKMAGWPLQRLNTPKPIGVTDSVAGFLDVSDVQLNAIREHGGITKPVLHAPVSLSTAA
jgi:acyl homoserine lactone synthase